MRAIVISGCAVVALCSACCDCAKFMAEKDEKIAELQEQVGLLQGKLEALESAQAPATEPVPAAGETSSGNPTDLATCLERLKACEKDPFKGGKYFITDKNAPPVDNKPPSGDAPADLQKGKQESSLKTEASDQPAKK